MPEVPRRPLSAVIVREDQARTVDRPRPQWQGLFVEPEWPPEEETD